MVAKHQCFVAKFCLQAQFEQNAKYRHFYSALCNKGKAFPILAWIVPEVSRRLRFPDFSRQSEHEGGKVISSQNRTALLHKEVFPVLISVRG